MSERERKALQLLGDARALSTLIPIDRTSIKRNERVGQSVSFFYPVASEAEMAVAFVDVGRDEQNRSMGILANRGEAMGHRVVRQQADRDTCFVEFAANPRRDLRADVEDLARVVEQRGAQVVWEMCRADLRVPKIQVWHAPIPRFAFAYVPTEVACQDCGAQFLHTALQGQESDYGAEYSDRVCPQCGALDCCNIRFEHMTDEELEDK